MTARATLSRRALFGGAVALVAVPPLAWLGLRGTGSPDDIVIGYLRRMLPGLAVPEADMREFASQYLEGFGEWVRGRIRLERALLLLARPGLLDALPEKMRLGQEDAARDLLTTFLFSTDFFTTAEARPERTVYVAYADPYGVGCRNPLSCKTLDA